MKAMFVTLTLLTAVCSITRDSLNGKVFIPKYPNNPDLSQYISVQSRLNQDPRLSVAMALSGGGYRASNLALGVMRSLEARGLLEQVDYITSVSGGGIAGGYYVSSLLDHLNKNENTKEYSIRTLTNEGQPARDLFRRNLSGTALDSWLDPRVVFTNLDRGDAIERDMDKHLLASRTRTAGSIFTEKNQSILLCHIFKPVHSELPPACAKSQTVRVPYLVPLGNIKRNGVIFPFAPDVLSRYQIVGCTHNFADACRTFAEVPLSVAIKASAAFPGLLPTSTLRSDFDSQYNPYLQLSDGGEADNLGVDTALSLLTQERILNKEVRKQILVVVDAWNGDAEPFGNHEGAPGIFTSTYYSASSGLEARRLQFLSRLKDNQYWNGIQVIHITLESLRSTDKTLFDQVFGVTTDLSISKEDQDRLILAGELLGSKVAF